MERTRTMNAPVPTQSSEPSFDYFAIVPRGGEPEVLLLSGAGGWSLPHFSVAEETPARIADVARSFREQTGLDVTVLRRVGDERHQEANYRSRVYILENHSPPETTPANGQWVGYEELQSITLARADHRVLLEEWFAKDAIGDVPPLRNDWERPGWFAEAADWIRRELERLGLSLTDRIEPLRSWSISCIMKAETAQGSVYFKAVPPMFGHEPRLTQALSERYPSHVPQVLAVEPERRWMLMREFTGPCLGEVKEIARWEEALRLLARMQIESLDRTEWLRSLGCPDRRLDRLAEQIEPLLADSAALAERARGKLTEEEAARLSALIPCLKALCAELEASPVPPALVHGDLHPYNIIASEEGILIYDWTDGCVAPPFFDFLPMEGWLPEFAESDAPARLRAAYLEPWAHLAPIETLAPLFEQSQTLAALHHAVSYQHIAANIEAVDEMEGGITRFLKILLARLTSPAEASERREGDT